MRRLGTTVAGTLLWLWILAAGALAQYPPTEPPPASPAGHGTNGTVAFTGASISLGVVILVMLLAAGAVLFLMGRRRRVGAVA